MKQSVFVLSDLHLGGEPGFEMCSPRGQTLLAECIRWITAQTNPEEPAHLVLAGDVVDFLAAEPFKAFTVDEAEAVRKLARIFERTRPIWDALRAHVASGAPLTILIGNHDIELTLPAPRRALIERLGRGRVEFLLDGEALRLGELLVEHGNRYDDWNWVNHDQLLHVRRELSRGRPLGEIEFEAVLGSRFVIDEMNPLKQRFPFVDLLKPEDAYVVPFVALLNPDLRANLPTIQGYARKYLNMRWACENIKPGGVRAIKPGGVRAIEQETERMLRLAAAVAEDPAAGVDLSKKNRTRGSWSTLTMLFNGSADRQVRLAKLLKVLRERHGDAAQAFDLASEAVPYLSRAREAAGRGFKAIVYGHTHLVKHVTTDLAGATYLNSGTWADLMRVPTSIFREDTPTADAIAELAAFADDISVPERSEKWRRQLPTFAFVALDAGMKVGDVGVHLFREGASLKETRIPQGTADFFEYAESQHKV